MKSESKNKTKRTAITPTRAQNYPEWYQQVIKHADLAENSVTRGCMIIKPWGFAIWENIQRILNDEFKKSGSQNVYFPLLIPMSFMQKEAEHIEGFAKECAVVTHHRLAADENGKLVPAGKLEEPFIIRPTSETIIGEAMSRWIQSYRDLPLKINQWANVMRWEMRTRMFLRTSEFLWQEGHTAHADKHEAVQTAMHMLDVYARFAEKYAAMPVIRGEKTPSERFPGAENTYTIEAMMQDKKALQAGTSHFLGQHFSKGFDIQYLSDEGQQQHCWTTSWGMSTRMIGGIIMTHSDDDGLILPPKIAPSHVVILPLVRNEEDRPAIMEYCDKIAAELRSKAYHGQAVGVEIDTRDLTNGEKLWSWVKKGIPVRIEIGKKELENQSVFMGRRDREYKDRRVVPVNEFTHNIIAELDDLQAHLLLRAETFRKENTVEINSKDDFYAFFKGEKGGFALAHWNGDEKVEKQIKQDLGVTTRCIPFDVEAKPGKCIFSGDESPQQVIWAKAY